MSNLLFIGALFLSLSGYGKAAPSFSGKLLSGKRTTLKENLQPGRFLFLSFWASWCEPCMQELADITKFKKENPQAALDVLTVNVDTSESASEIKPTMTLKKFDFPVVLDPNREVFTKFFKEQSLPFSCVVDSKGEIVKSFTGYNSTMLSEIETVLGVVKK